MDFFFIHAVISFSFFKHAYLRIMERVEKDMERQTSGRGKKGRNIIVVSSCFKTLERGLV